MKTETVICDQCGTNLTKTSNGEAYRIVVASERIPNPGRTATLLSLPDPLPGALHFCGLRCLAKYAAVQL